VSENINMLQDNLIDLRHHTGAGSGHLGPALSSVPSSRSDLISALAGEIYGDAPEKLRARLLELLLHPISPYALMAIPGSGGLFAQIRGRNAEWQGFQVEPADITRVGVDDVTVLVEWLLRLGTDPTPRLVALVKSSSTLADCQAVSTLLALHDPQLQA
jgi:hypothetical protein